MYGIGTTKHLGGVKAALSRAFPLGGGFPGVGGLPTTYALMVQPRSLVPIMLHPESVGPWGPSLNLCTGISRVLKTARADDFFPDPYDAVLKTGRWRWITEWAIRWSKRRSEPIKSSSYFVPRESGLENLEQSP